jgi:hypothetical protein
MADAKAAARQRWAHRKAKHHEDHNNGKRGFVSGNVRYQRELADDGRGTRPVEADLSAAQEQAQADGQVEAASVFLQVSEMNRRITRNYARQRVG